MDQACSGINGLQASLVVSIFVGAYYSFGIIQRILLIAAGLLLALFFNLGRAFCLSFITVKGKGHILEKPILSIGNYDLPNVHDLVGYIETGFILLAILIFARFSRRGFLPSTLATRPNFWGNLKFRPPVAFSVITLITIICTLVLTEFHFKSIEKAMVPLPRIDLDMSGHEIIRNDQVISNQVRAQLHFAEATSFQWQDRYRSRWNQLGYPEINLNEEYWQVFKASWNSGGACTAVLSTHSPQSCLPLTGLNQVSPAIGENPILIPVIVGNRKIMFEAYEFSRSFRKLFVFRSFWPEKQVPGQLNKFPSGGYSFKGRINSAIKGHRNVGGTMLAFALANVDSLQTASSKLQLFASERLVLNK